MSISLKTNPPIQTVEQTPQPKLKLNLGQRLKNFFRSSNFSVITRPKFIASNPEPQLRTSSQEGKIVFTTIKDKLNKPQPKITHLNPGKNTNPLKKYQPTLDTIIEEQGLPEGKPKRHTQNHDSQSNQSQNKQAPESNYFGGNEVKRKIFQEIIGSDIKIRGEKLNLLEQKIKLNKNIQDEDIHLARSLIQELSFLQKNEFSTKEQRLELSHLIHNTQGIIERANYLKERSGFLDNVKQLTKLAGNAQILNLNTLGQLHQHKNQVSELTSQLNILTAENKLSKSSHADYQNLLSQIKEKIDLAIALKTTAFLDKTANRIENLQVKITSVDLSDHQLEQLQQSARNIKKQLNFLGNAGYIRSKDIKPLLKAINEIINFTEKK